MTSRTWTWLALSLLVPLSAWGQQAAASGARRTQPNPPDTTASINADAGLDTPSPGGLPGARNFLSWGADFSTAYDDNVRQTNEDRLADTGFVISPRLQAGREDGRLVMSLNYRPTFLLYQHQTGYNEQDHDLSFDTAYRATDRLHFRLQANALYRRGLPDSFFGTQPISEPPTPGTLNDTIAAPFASQLDTNSRADLSYAISPRAALGVFGTYMLRSFAKSSLASVPLYRTEGESAGLRYMDRTSPRTTLGLTYLEEVLHTGAGTRVNLSTASLAWIVALTPNLQVNLFGGPAYANVRGSLLVPLGPLVTLSIPLSRSDWHWAAGGGIAYETPNNQFRLSGSRQVTDGGGLFDAVTSDVIEGSFERRLARRWKVEGSASWERNTALEGSEGPGQVGGEYGRTVLLHSISRALTAGAGYQFQRQQARGTVPLGASFDRDFVYFTLSYRFEGIPGTVNHAAY